MPLESDTDTECIVKLLKYLYDKDRKVIYCSQIIFRGLLFIASSANDVCNIFSWEQNFNWITLILFQQSDGPHCNFQELVEKAVAQLVSFFIFVEWNMCYFMNTLLIQVLHKV